MTKTSLSWFGMLAVIVLLTVWGLIIILPDFCRVFYDKCNNKLPFEANNDGILSDNTDPKNPVGDCERIDLPRSYCAGQLSDLLAVFGGMGGEQYVARNLDSVSLYFVCKRPAERQNNVVQSADTTPIRSLCRHRDDVSVANSQLRKVDTHNEPLSLWARGFLFLAQISGIFFIGVAFWLVLNRPSAVTWGFFLYAIWFNPGQYYVFYALLQQQSPYALLTQEVAQAVFQAIGYCGFILFALRFPHNKIEARWQWMEKALPVIGMAILIIQLCAFLPVFGFQVEWAARLTFISGAVVDVIVLTILFIRYREHSFEDRQRIRFVFWCCVIGLSAFLLADTDVATTLLHIRLREWVIYLLYSLNALVAVAVWYAVRKYRVVDVKFALSRHATYVVLWIGMAAVLVWGADTVRRYGELLQAQNAKPLTTIGIAFALLVAGVGSKFVVDFIQEYVLKILDSFFFRKLLQAQSHLQRVQDLLTQSKGNIPPERIDQKLVDEPVTSLDLASGATFRSQPDTSLRRTPLARGWPDDTIDVLPADTYLVRTLASGTKSALRLEPNVLPAKMPTGTASPALAVAVTWGGELRAIVLYGAHRAGDDLNGDEVKMLAELAGAASVAYTNFELVSLRGRVHELEQQIGFVQ